MSVPLPQSSDDSRRRRTAPPLSAAVTWAEATHQRLKEVMDYPARFEQSITESIQECCASTTMNHRCLTKKLCALMLEYSGDVRVAVAMCQAWIGVSLRMGPYFGLVMPGVQWADIRAAEERIAMELGLRPKDGSFRLPLQLVHFKLISNGIHPQSVARLGEDYPALLSPECTVCALQGWHVTHGHFKDACCMVQIGDTLFRSSDSISDTTPRQILNEALLFPNVCSHRVSGSKHDSLPTRFNLNSVTIHWSTFDSKSENKAFQFPDLLSLVNDSPFRWEEPRPSLLGSDVPSEEEKISECVVIEQATDEDTKDEESEETPIETSLDRLPELVRLSAADRLTRVQDFPLKYERQMVDAISASVKTMGFESWPLVLCVVIMDFSGDFAIAKRMSEHWTRIALRLGTLFVLASEGVEWSVIRDTEARLSVQLSRHPHQPYSLPLQLVFSVLICNGIRLPVFWLIKQRQMNLGPEFCLSSIETWMVSNNEQGCDLVMIGQSSDRCKVFLAVSHSIEMQPMLIPGADEPRPVNHWFFRSLSNNQIVVDDCGFFGRRRQVFDCFADWMRDGIFEWPLNSGQEWFDVLIASGMDSAFILTALVLRVRPLIDEYIEGASEEDARDELTVMDDDTSVVLSANGKSVTLVNRRDLFAMVILALLDDLQSVCLAGDPR